MYKLLCTNVHTVLFCWFYFSFFIIVSYQHIGSNPHIITVHCCRKNMKIYKTFLLFHQFVITVSDLRCEWNIYRWLQNLFFQGYNSPQSYILLNNSHCVRPQCPSASPQKTDAQRLSVSNMQIYIYIIYFFYSRMNISVSHSHMYVPAISSVYKP